EADPVHTIRRLQFAGSYERGFVVRADDGTVDRTVDLIALDRHGNLLRHGLVLAWRLVHRVVRLSTSTVHLEGLGTESPDDKGAIAVCRAVQVAFLRGPQVVAADHDAIRVRVIVEVHVLR